MDGKIFNSDGQYVAHIRANGIYDLEQIPIMLNHILRPRSSLCILPA